MSCHEVPLRIGEQPPCFHATSDRDQNSIYFINRVRPQYPPRLFVRLFANF